MFDKHDVQRVINRLRDASRSYSNAGMNERAERAEELRDVAKKARDAFGQWNPPECARDELEEMLIRGGSFQEAKGHKNTAKRTYEMANEVAK